MNRSLLYTLLFVCLATLVLSAPPALAQSDNLLQNPSFEGGYSAYTPRTPQEHADCPDGICNTVQIPAGWYPWWVKEQGTDANPEYKSAGAPFMNRVRDGGQAAQYFTFHRTHKAGFYQQANVPANATVQFSIWGQTWVSNSDDPTSDRNAPINMRIGIDPYGGTDPYSPNIVWSGLQQPYDAYHQFVVQAQAQGSRVTVFTYSAPPFPMRHNDVYWDDASLVVVGQQPGPPPEQEPAPGSTPQTHTVQPGETLSAIARQYGLTVADLVAANNIANPNVIHSGQVLTLPGAAEAPAEQPAPAPTGTEATTQANLRLRAGPGTNHEILTVVPYGTALPVQARNQAGDWIQVSYQGQVGWMAAWYTAISGNLNAVPVQ